MFGDDLAKDFVEPNSDFPVGIVRLELGKICDVTDVIALAIFLHVISVQLLPCHLLDFAYGFEHRNTVFAAATKIVHLAAMWIRGKLFNGTDHIIAVDVVVFLSG